MRFPETPRQADNLSRDDYAQSRTDRILANADALLEDAGRAIADNQASLKQSRTFLSSADTAHAHEAINRVWSELVQEMVEAGDSPTREQLELWRDCLTAAANLIKAQEAESSGESKL
jgi:enamine deaminase RidA (YjgF/YER057c/UK114 family)